MSQTQQITDLFINKIRQDANVLSSISSIVEKMQEEGFTRNWPDVIEMDAATKSRIDAIWPSLGLGGR